MDLFFLFHRVDTIGNIFTSGTATNKFRSLTEKKPHQMLCLFHAFNPFWEELYQNSVQFFFVIPRGVPLPHSNALQYYVKRKKCKVNDVVFQSGREARAINLDNKNMKSIFSLVVPVQYRKIFSLLLQDIIPESMK